MTAATLTSATAAREAGADTPRLDAELLLGGWLPRLDRPDAAPRETAPPRRRCRPTGTGGFESPVARRVAASGGLIVGRKGFRERRVAVDRRVLVPRPEPSCSWRRSSTLPGGSAC